MDIKTAQYFKSPETGKNTSISLTFNNSANIMSVPMDKDNSDYQEIPSDKVPSDVVSVCVVPESVIAPTPLVSLSMMSKFVFVVVPHVPDCSPEPIFSIPPLAVYVETMPYLYISVHVCEAPVDISVHVCDAPVVIFV